MVHLVTAVIKPHRLDEVKDSLRSVGVIGLTASEVRGFGRQGGKTENYRGSEYTVDLIPKIKIEVLVNSSDADKVIETIAAAVTAWLFAPIAFPLGLATSWAEIGGFVAWLRLPPIARDQPLAVLPSVTGGCAESTVNRKLSAVSAFYLHAARDGVEVSGLLRVWRPAGRRGRSAW